MKRLICLAVVMACACAHAGSYGFNATIHADTATNMPLTGTLGTTPVSAVVDGAAAGLTALQPTNAAALSVAEAQRIVQADSNAWLVLSGGTGVLYRVERSATANTNRIEVVSASESYDGSLAVGSVHTFNSVQDDMVLYGVFGALILYDITAGQWSI